MADLSDRDSLEAELARRLARALQQIGGIVVQSVDRGPGATIAWGEASDLLLSVMEPALLEAWRQMGEQTEESLNFPLDDMSAAESLFMQMVRELVTGINTTSAERTAAILREYFEKPTTLAQLRQRLEPIFGARRAALIASTEITRAASAGQRAVIDEIEKQGIKMQGTWQTNRDEDVCPICKPLNGKKTDGEKKYTHPNGQRYNAPPAHPRCRCWENWVIER